MIESLRRIRQSGSSQSNLTDSSVSNCRSGSRFPEFRSLGHLNDLRVDDAANFYKELPDAGLESDLAGRSFILPS